MPETPEPEKILEAILVPEQRGDAAAHANIAAHSAVPPGRTIAFKDFIPKEGTKPTSTLFGEVQVKTFADLEEAVERANKWIARKGVQVVNVETVFLPNFGESDQSTATTNFSNMADRWRQFVRVWYLE